MTWANNQKHQRSKSLLKRQKLIEVQGLMIMRRRSPSRSETNFSLKARKRKLDIWCIK